MSHFLLSCVFRQHPVLLTFCKISLGLCPGPLLPKLVGVFGLYWSRCTVLVREKVIVWLSEWTSVLLLPKCVVPLSCHRTAHPFGGQSGWWLASSQAVCGGGIKQAGFVGSR